MITRVILVNRNLSLLAAMLVSMAGPVARATTYYWDSNDGTAGFGTAGGTWAVPTAGTTTSGWSTDSTGGTVVNGNSVTTGTADPLNFGTASAGLAAGTITISGTVSANSLTFGSASGVINLSGGTNTLGGTLPTITVNNTSNNISALINGTGGLTKNGSGTLILQPPAGAGGAKAIPTGSITNNGGILGFDLVNAGGDRDLAGSYTINNGARLLFYGTGNRELFNGSSFTYGSTGGGNVTIDSMNAILNGSTFTTTGGSKNTLNGSANFNCQGNNLTFNVATGSDPVGLEFSGNAGNLKLIKSGAGVMTISSTANATGIGIQIIAGTLEIASGGRLNSGSYAANITNDARFVYNSSADQTLSGIISGTGSLTKTNTSTLTLSNTNSYTGNITIDGGTLAPNLVSGVANPVVSPLGNPQTAGRLVTIGSAGTLNFSSSDVMGNGGTIAQLKLVANGGTIRNNGNLFNALGPVDLNGGTLSSFGGLSASFPSFALRGTITVGGSAVSTISSTGGNSQMGLETSGTTFDVADAVAGSDLNVTAVLANWNSNAGALIKAGSGTLTLSGANTYTGGTTLNSGTLNINAVGVLNVSGPLGNGGILTINAGTIDNTSGAAKVLLNVNPITLGSNFSFSTSAGTANNNLTLPGGVSMAADKTITLNGAGVLAFSGTWTNAGDSARTLIVTNGSTTTTFGSLTMGAYNLTGTGSTAPRTNSIAGNGNLTISGVIADGVSAGSGLTYGGSGTMTLSGANTYGGDTTISAGTLKLGASNVIPDGSGKGNVVMSGTATLDLGGFSDTINGLTGASGNVVDNSSSGGPYTLTVGGNDQSSTFAGVIKNTSGTLALTKAGTSTLTLSGTNTYSGSTTVSGGSLVLTGGLSTNMNQVVVNGANASLFVTNGARQFSSGALTLGAANVTNCSMVTAGNGSVWNLNAQTMSWGGSTNTFLVTGGAVVTNHSGNFAGGGGYGNTIAVQDGGNIYLGGQIFLGQFSSGNRLLVGGAGSASTMIISGAGIQAPQQASAVLNNSNGIIITNGLLKVGGFGVSVGRQNSSRCFFEIYSGGLFDANGTGLTIADQTNSTANYLLIDGGVMTNVNGLSLGSGVFDVGNTGRVINGGAIWNRSALTVGSAAGAQFNVFNIGGGSTASSVSNTTVALGAAGADYNSITVTNATWWSSATTIGNTSSNNSVTVLANSIWNMNASTIAVGVSPGTGNVLTVAGGLVTNAGAITVAAANTLYLDGGTLASGANGNFLAGSGTAYVRAGGATFDTVGFTSTNTLGLTVDPTSTSGGLTKNGSGTLALASANSYTNTTLINAGTLQLGGGGTSGSLDTNSAITVASGATFAISHSDTVTQGSHFSGAAITGAGGFLHNGSGTSVFTVVNTYAGGTTLRSGTLSISNGAAMGGGSVTFTGGTLQIAANITVTNGVSISSGSSGTVDVISANSGILSGIISGGGAFSKSGAGTLTPTGTNTYSGSTTVNAGTLIVKNNSSLGDTAGNTVVANNSTAFLQIDGSAGALTLAESIVVQGSQAGSIRNLAGTNTITGPVTLTTGTDLRIFAGSLTFSGGITSTNQQLSLNGTSIVTNIPVNLGSGQMLLTSGTITFNVGGNTWGSTLINFAGVATLGLDNALPTNSALSFGYIVSAGAAADTGTLNLNGFNQKVASIETYPDILANPVASRVGTRTITGGGTLTVSQLSTNKEFEGTISDGATATALIMASTNMLTLSGTNSYSGGTIVSNGILDVQTSLAGTGAVRVASGGTLAATSVVGVVSIESGGAITPRTGAVGTLRVPSLSMASGSILNFEFINNSSNDLIIVTNTAGLALNGGRFNLFQPGTTNAFDTSGRYNLISYTGGFSGSLANLSVINSNSTKDYIFGTNNSFVTLTIKTVIGWDGSGEGLGTPNLRWTLSTNWARSSVPGSYDTLIFGGSSQGLQNTNDFAANTPIGGIAFTNGAGPFVLSSLTPANVLNLVGTIENSSANLQTINIPLLLQDGNQTVNAISADVRINGIIGETGGSYGLIKSGASVLTLGATNTFSGNLTINAGTLEFVSSGLGGGSAITFAGPSGLKWFYGNTEDVSSRTLTMTMDTTLDTSSNNVTLANAIGNAGTGALIKAGSGTLTLSAANNFSGRTAINEGAILFSALNNLGSGSMIQFGGGTLQWNSGNTIDISTRTVSLAGDGTLDVGTNNVTLANSVGNSGIGRLVKAGSGTLTLSAANTQTGGTTLNAGTLNMNNAAALGSGIFTVGNTSTIDNASGVAISNSQNNAQTWLGDFTFAGTTNLHMGVGPVTMLASTMITVSNATLVEGGAISGTGVSLSKLGAGTLTLSGSNTFDGGLILSNGTLNLNHASALGAGAFTIDGGTMDNTSGAAISNSQNNAQNWNTDFTFAGSSSLNMGTGAVALAATRQLSVTTNTLTVGPISDGGSSYGLTKTGDGTLVLSVNNSHSGTTAVNAGTLQVDGSSTGSPVTVAASARLSGSGELGQVTLSSSAIVTPGSTSRPGLLTASNIVLATSGRLEFLATNVQVGAQEGVDSSMLRIGSGGANTVDISALTTANPFVISVSAPASLAGWNNQKFYEWKVIHAAGWNGTFDLRKFQINTNGWSPSLNGGELYLAESNGSLYVRFDLNLLATQTVANASGHRHLEWTWATGNSYDVLYTDAASFSDALSNTWATLTNTTTASYDDTSTLASGTFRFYRAAQTARWQTGNTPRRASLDVLAAKKITLVPGENWVSLPFEPVDNRIASVLGTNILPSGISVATGTKVSWYAQANSATATSVVWLASSGNWMEGASLANDKQLPATEGFNIEIPGIVTQSLVIVGRVTTNVSKYAIGPGVGGAGGEVYSIRSLGIPRATPISETGFKSILTAGINPIYADEIRILNNTLGIGSKMSPAARIWLRSTDNTFRFTTSGSPSAEAYIFQPGDALVIIRHNAGTVTSTNALHYTVPTRDMSP